MAGALVSTVEVDAVVEVGEVVAVIEAMKTETALHADTAGQVVEVRVAPGQVVAAGTVIAVVR